jgi:predicted patatin/cPLA2 family phospholipase
MITTLCISGGGIKGFSFISSLAILIKYNFINLENINKYVGSSVGSIVAFLLCIDYTPIELLTYFKNFDFKKIELSVDLNLFLTNHGFNDGTIYIEIIKLLFERKYKLSNINFYDLEILTKKKLYIYGTNFTKGTQEIFSSEHTPEMLIMDALRISISLPIILTPVKYNDNYYVDGSILNNIGIELCDPKNTLCITLKKSKKYKLDNCFDLVISIIHFLIAKEKKEIKNFKNLIIYSTEIYTEISCDPIYFNKLINNGRKSAIKFLIKEYKDQINKLIHLNSLIIQNKKNNIIMTSLLNNNIINDEIIHITHITHITNEPTNKINNDPTNEIDNETTNEIDNETTNEIDNETTNEIDNETTNEINNETTNEIDNETTNEIDNETTNEINNETTNEINNETTNGIDNETTNEINNGINNEITNEINNEINNDTAIEIVYQKNNEPSNQTNNDTANQISNEIKELYNESIK